MHRLEVACTGGGSIWGSETQTSTYGFTSLGLTSVFCTNITSLGTLEANRGLFVRFDNSYAIAAGVESIENTDIRDNYFKPASALVDMSSTRIGD